MALDDSSEIKRSKGSVVDRTVDLEVAMGRHKERLYALKDRVDKVEEDLKEIKESGSMSEVADTRLTAEVAQLKEETSAIFTKLESKPDHRDLQVQQANLEKLLDELRKTMTEHKVAAEKAVTDLKAHMAETFKAKDAKWFKNINVWINIMAVIVAVGTLAYLVVRGV